MKLQFKSWISEKIRNWLVTLYMVAFGLRPRGEWCREIDMGAHSKISATVRAQWFSLDRCFRDAFGLRHWANVAEKLPWAHFSKDSAPVMAHFFPFGRTFWKCMRPTFHIFFIVLKKKQISFYLVIFRPQPPPDSKGYWLTRIYPCFGKSQLSGGWKCRKAHLHTNTFHLNLFPGLYDHPLQGYSLEKPMLKKTLFLEILPKFSHFRWLYLAKTFHMSLFPGLYDHSLQRYSLEKNRWRTDRQTDTPNL